MSDSAVSSSQLSWHWCFPTINVSNSVAYWALNAGGYAVAAIALIVLGNAVFRYFKPEQVNILASKLAGEVTFPVSQVVEQGFRFCYFSHVDSISYTWYLSKKKTTRYFFANTLREEIDSKTPVYRFISSFPNGYNFATAYVYQSNTNT